MEIVKDECIKKVLPLKISLSKYLTAKNEAAFLQEKENKIEESFLKANGRAEKRIWQITDECVFAKLNNEIDKDFDLKKVFNLKVVAQEKLRDSENAVISAYLKTVESFLSLGEFKELTKKLTDWNEKNKLIKELLKIN